jgi:hypothetical protein
MNELSYNLYACTMTMNQTFWEENAIFHYRYNCADVWWTEFKYNCTSRNVCICNNLLNNDESVWQWIKRMNTDWNLVIIYDMDEELHGKLLSQIRGFTWKSRSIVLFNFFAPFIQYWLIDWLIIYGFTSRSRIFHLYKETSPLPVKGCKIKAYARRLGPLSRWGFLSCHTCCDTGPRFFPVSSEGPLHLVASYDTRGDVENLF